MCSFARMFLLSLIFITCCMGSTTGFVQLSPKKFVPFPRFENRNWKFSSVRLSPSLLAPVSRCSSRSRMPSSLWAIHIRAVASRSLPLETRGILLLATVVILYWNKQRLFYPGTSPDTSFVEPLPPGDFRGCPLFGTFSPFTGFNRYLTRVSSKLGSPKIFKFFGLTKPIATFSGSGPIKKLLNMEFKQPGVSQLVQIGNFGILFGVNSMSSAVKCKAEYHFLRRLVGQAMTTDAVAKGIPALQTAAENSVKNIISSDGSIVVEKECNHFTLDVAWRQILGLQLKESEVEAFHTAAKDWISGLASITAYVPNPFVKQSRCYKARLYLISTIQKKIDELERDGPDGSTISAMYFATEENGSKRLSREQVIDNSMLLILAGSETSASTLTNAMLILGLHPHALDKIAAEQAELVSKHGESLTMTQLDDECPYLDAVFREVMRLIPISGGGARGVDGTIVIDGLQIPKNWLALYSLSLTHENDPITWKEDGSHMDIKLGFWPERWFNDTTKPTSEFMPFGAGYRYCLGHILAMAEMKTFLATLARRTKFRLSEKSHSVEWKEGIIMTPKDGVIIECLGAQW